MLYAIQITNDPGHPNELWGPYATQSQADDIMNAFVGVPESAVVIPVEDGMEFTGRPE